MLDSGDSCAENGVAITFNKIFIVKDEWSLGNYAKRAVIYINAFLIYLMARSQRIEANKMFIIDRNTNFSVKCTSQV